MDITDAGRAVVERVTARRRSDFSRILRRMPVPSRRMLVDALEALRSAAGEPPEHRWTLGFAI